MNDIQIVTFFSSGRDVKNKASLLFDIAYQLSSTGNGVLCIDFDSNLYLTRYFIKDNNEIINLIPKYSNNLLGESINELTNQTSPQTTNSSSETAFDIFKTSIYKNEENHNLHLMIGDFLNSQRSHPINIEREGLNESNEFISQSIELNHKLKKLAHANGQKFIFLNINPEISALEKEILIFSNLMMNIIQFDRDIDSQTNIHINRRIYVNLRRLISNYSAVLNQQTNNHSLPLFNRIIRYTRRNISLQSADEHISSIDRRYFGVPQNTFEDTIAFIPEFPSLIDMAERANKSILNLTPSDGIIGAHNEALLQYRKHIMQTASILIERHNISL
jgi:cellulose biosynthesis protein BcsQ